MPAPLRVLALEPYAARSHQVFLEGLGAASRHALVVESLPPRAWKWRMRTAAFWARDRVLEHAPDLLLASDYLNLAELRALLPRGRRDVPALVYFHENQLSYPMLPGERRDVHHGLTNLHAACTAEAVAFNSRHHLREFLASARELVRRVPDLALAPEVGAVEGKAEVLPLGTDLAARGPATLAPGEDPVIVWSHRWEHDKAPEAFLEVVDRLAARGTRFRLALLGQRFRERPPALAAIEARHAARLVHGEARDRASYLAALDAGHVVVSTARHEFFGVATLEALRRGLAPVLPDALAYPELLPADVRDQRVARLVEPAWRDPEPTVRALEATFEALRDGTDARDRAERAALVTHTERFTWERLAPRYDALFERVAGA